MNEIIDVEYKELGLLEDKSTETLTIETNNLWQQMETIGAMGMMLAAQAGQRLNVIRDRIPHGQWEEWCRDNLKFSYRKAARLMNLATKIEDENSLFSNLPTLADIEISKVYELLAAPEEVVKEVIENNDVADITVKELREELKKSKEALKSRDYDIEALQETVRKLNVEKNNAADPAELEELKLKLLKAEDKLKKAKDAQKKTAEDAQKKAEEELSKSIEAAKEEARKEVSNDMDCLKAELEAALGENKKLTQALSNNNNKELAVFKVKSDQLQSDFNSCLESIAALKKQDSELADKANQALKQVLTALIDKL